MKLIAQLSIGLLLVGSLALAQAQRVPVVQELTHSGDNYDDPCFWQHPFMEDRARAFITSKDDKLVDAFDLATGEHRGSATGFREMANNCAVDTKRHELVTTDPLAEEILVHSLPELTLLRRITDPLFREPSGICVSEGNVPWGPSFYFVTDESRDEVLVISSETGSVLYSFDYLLDEAEGIICDDYHDRVVVCDDRSDDRGCRAFSYAGDPIGEEFGIAETGSDAEGVALYDCGQGTGYIIVSDQKNDEFEIFDRNSFSHLCSFSMHSGSDRTNDTDGIDVFQGPAAPRGGIFGACDNCRGSSDELDIALWADIAIACGIAMCWDVTSTTLTPTTTMAPPTTLTPTTTVSTSTTLPPTCEEPIDIVFTGSSTVVSAGFPVICECTCQGVP